jgi:hypothetical protein
MKYQQFYIGRTRKRKEKKVIAYAERCDMYFFIRHAWRFMLQRKKL